MSKRTFLTKRPKKFLIFLMACLITIILAGCDSANKNPTGGLSSMDATYASAETENGNFTVTVGDVYGKLRYNAVDYLEQSVYKFIYESEIKTVEAAIKDGKRADKDATKLTLNEQILKRLDEKILTDIYGTADEEKINDLSGKKEEMVGISSFIDEKYQEGYKITKAQIENRDFSSVYPSYYLELAKYVAAYNKLSAEFSVENGYINFGDITDDSYFDKKEVAAWYDANHTNKGDVTALLIRFVNSTEANEVLKEFGLISSGGKWYQIQEPANKDDWSTPVKYDAYYDKYKLDLTGASGNEAIDGFANGKATILRIYAAIYNYVYTYRSELYGDLVLDTETKVHLEDYSNLGHLQYYSYIRDIIAEDQKTNKDNPENDKYEKYVDQLLAYDKKVKDAHKEEDHEVETIVMSKERMDKYSTSLTSYLYNNLKTEADEDGKSFTQYLTSSKSVGGYNYLLFKIDQVKDVEIYTEKENDDKEKEIIFNTDEESKALIETVLYEMFDDEIDTTYINNIFNERLEEVELKIYDTVVENQFMYSSSSKLAESYEKNKKKNNDLLALVTYQDVEHEIKVTDVYSYLEPLYGPQLASNLLFQKYIKTTSYYAELQDEYDSYEETIKLMLNYFTNDYYASSGYPAAIGQHDFMVLYFGTADIESAIKDYLMVSDATNAFYGDFAARANDEKTFINNLHAYATETADEYYSLTISGLSVYVDMDEDGEPDKIEDADLLLQAQNLLSDAYGVVIKSQNNYQTAMKDVVADYNNSSRIPDTDKDAITPESRWANYRKAGLFLEVTSFGTFTNTTDYTGNENIEKLVVEYKDKVIDNKLGFTSEYLCNVNEVFETEDNKLSIALFTAGAKKVSAKFETENKTELGLYEEIYIVLNDKQEKVELTYTSDSITQQQVRVYVAEYILYGDVYSLPSTTVAALDAYLLPVITKYTGSASQFVISKNILKQITFNDSLPLSSEFGTEFATSYNRKAFFDEYTTILKNSEDNYDLQYEGWWTNMYTEGGSN